MINKTFWFLSSKKEPQNGFKQGITLNLCLENVVALKQPGRRSQSEETR